MSSLTFARLFVSLFGAVSGYLAWAAIEAHQDWKTNTQPTEMRLGDYLALEPKGNWLRLTHCYVDYPAGVLFRNKFNQNQVSDLAIPVYQSNDRSRPVQFVLNMRNVTIDDVAGFPKTIQCEVLEGTLHTGPFAGMNSDLQKVATWKTAEHYAMLERDDRPGPEKVELFATGSGIFALMTVAGLFSLFMIAREQATPAEPEPWQPAIDKLYAEGKLDAHSRPTQA